MLKTRDYEFWFVTGSQNLYGEDVVRQVEEHSRKMVAGLDEDQAVTYKLVFKSVLKEADSIRRLFLEANADENCAGVVTWMHTFSPSKMWIAGLNALKKPLLHLHTQFNQDIPWDSIDMDFMNLNQSAHGDREFGFIGSRMNIKRKVVVGHWESAEVRARIGSWMRTAVAVSESQSLKVARFGDNMRQVAVTEGDKVEAQIKLGWTVDGYGVGDLVERIDAVTEQDINQLMDEYSEKYTIVPEGLQDGAVRDSIRYQAKLELALKAFLEEGGYTAFSNTFEDLHGMRQLPGLATQRLMEQGYGYGGEGDWKTAALVRLMKIIADGKDTSFMEDYTYHFEPGNEMVLGAHMLEVCPTIAEAKPTIEVHPLGIGGKEDPARLVFNGHEGAALNASIIDLGHRFRLVINEVDAVKIEEDMPKLPVARVLWKLQPSMTQGAENWIMAGGAHHSCFSYRVTSEQLKDFADLLGIESVLINKDTKTPAFENELRLNELFYRQ
ncbi:L-arabinose isomerase [Lederbergia sp. NSJ-179]|uniref:L-arabinose isomerase n=1 Tax=Lederbergia sp. NSJ-179 TaxID=2931402 RepID=UPI001FD1E639|nr:L-arabinose isomerase [Lederbergia sp. NSJ-179]MCJ7842270.1 L-arabinose isomerase [Lederbergia sp. NSJ-179]